MVCLFCGYKTQVINSRLQKRANQVWRRRHCPNCGKTFTTEESASLDRSLQFKGSATPQPFIREMLFLSLHSSLAHRPTALRDAAELTQTVVAKLLNNVQDQTVDRETVVQSAATVLKRFDKAAATTYLAYHPLQRRPQP